MLTACYRKDYTGGSIVVNTDIHLGIKQQRQWWIHDFIVDQHRHEPGFTAISNLET
jgi:hypothetical protein